MIRLCLCCSVSCEYNRYLSNLIFNILEVSVAKQVALGPTPDITFLKMWLSLKFKIIKKNQTK